MRHLPIAMVLLLAITLSVMPYDVVAQEEYQKVDPSELNFDFRCSFSGASSTADGIEIKGGVVKKFTLNGVEISLNTKKNIGGRFY